MLVSFQVSIREYGVAHPTRRRGSACRWEAPRTGPPEPLLAIFRRPVSWDRRQRLDCQHDDAEPVRQQPAPYL